MQALSFEEVLEQILKSDQRYHRDAYVFLREALDHTQRALNKEKEKESRGLKQHVTPRELLDGIRAYALQQYGPMAITLFEEWNVRACRDFGELVFTLVEYGLLAKTDQDTREDFDQGYDFHDAFRLPYLPLAKQTRKLLSARTASA